MLDALGEVAGDRVVAVILAELAVAHCRCALPTASISVLIAEQCQGNAHARHLLADVVPIGLLEDAFLQVSVGKEQAVRLVIGRIRDIFSSDVALCGDIEDLAHRLHGHMPRRGYLSSRHPLLAKLHDKLRPYLSRNDCFSSLDWAAWRVDCTEEDISDTEAVERLIRMPWGKRQAR